MENYYTSALQMEILDDNIVVSELSSEASNIVELNGTISSQIFVEHMDVSEKEALLGFHPDFDEIEFVASVEILFYLDPEGLVIIPLGLAINHVNFIKPLMDSEGDDLELMLETLHQAMDDDPVALVNGIVNDQTFAFGKLNDDQSVEPYTILMA